MTDLKIKRDITPSTKTLEEIMDCEPKAIIVCSKGKSKTYMCFDPMADNPKENETEEGFSENRNDAHVFDEEWAEFLVMAFQGALKNGETLYTEKP